MEESATPFDAELKLGATYGPSYVRHLTPSLPRGDRMPGREVQA